MSLRDLIPPVPQNVEVLNFGSAGIYVVTLQLWLKMLGYDCGKVDGVFGPSVKTQVLKFKKEHRNEITEIETVDLDVWSIMNDLLKDKLPPDPEAIERIPFPEEKDYETEEAYAYAVRIGLESFGFRPELQGGEFYLEIDESGFGILDNIPAGIYSLEMDNDSDKSTSKTDYNDEAGSMEVRLYDENENPISGKVKLTNETPDPESLRKMIRLFKALSYKKDLLEDKYGDEVHEHAIDGKLHASNREMWNDYKTTWGQFYGAPWMGIMFDPICTEDITIQSNFTNDKTASMLYQWGAEHLNSKEESDYQLIGVNYLNAQKGGMINKRNDFSQTGNSLSLHLPRGTSRKTDNTDTGQKYGDVGYDSDDYNRAAFKLMLKNQINLKSDFQIRTKDKELVASLSEFEGDVMWKYNNSSNADINEKTTRSIQINVKVKIEGAVVTFPVSNAEVSITDVNGNPMRLKSGLKKLTTSFEGKVKLPKKYLRKSVGDAKAPYKIHINISENDKTSFTVTEDVKKTIELDFVGNYFNYFPEKIEPGLYVNENGQWKKIPNEVVHTKTTYRNLIEGKFTELFIVKVTNPFSLNPGQKLVFANDDEFLPPVRDDLIHIGVDIGSRLVESNGEITSFTRTTLFNPIVNEGYFKGGESPFPYSNPPIVLPSGIEQKIGIQHVNYCLVLKLHYGHVVPKIEIERWTPYNKGIVLAELAFPTGPKLTLGASEFYTAKVEPSLTGQVKKKGLHIHLRVDGMYERVGNYLPTKLLELRINNVMGSKERTYLESMQKFYRKILMKITS